MMEIQVTILRAYRGRLENLAPPDAFLLTLIRAVPRIAMKVGCFLCVSQFDETVHEVWYDVKTTGSGNVAVSWLISLSFSRPPPPFFC
jgi:hypothetical protein